MTFSIVDMVQAALEAGQADPLSDHPTTQAVLQQLREGCSVQDSNTQSTSQEP